MNVSLLVPRFPSDLYSFSNFAQFPQPILFMFFILPYPGVLLLFSTFFIAELLFLVQFTHTKLLIK